MKTRLIALMFLAFTAGTFAQTKKATPKKAVAKTTQTAKPEGIFATIETNKGRIVLELEYKKTPITVANFMSLAEGTNNFVNPKYKGKPFYTGLKFHRVITDFMIQGGDPAGNGSGDPGYKFKDEITDLKHSGPGILSMANSGPTTNGSQFFITHKETPWLDGKHTVFGKVISGQDVVNAIAQDDVIIEIKFDKKGSEAKKFDAGKIFNDYFANKDVEAKKIAEAMAIVKKEKVTELAKLRETATKLPSGLSYVVTKKGSETKPVDGTQVYVHYAGFLEDGTLFDSSYEDISKKFDKFDQRRADANGYQPLPSTVGQHRFVPGFTEGLNQLNVGDKAVLFIPAELGYGARGAGNVIPPNANIIFEVELLDKLPAKE